MAGVNACCTLWQRLFPRTKTGLSKPKGSYWLIWKAISFLWVTSNFIAVSGVRSSPHLNPFFLLLMFLFISILNESWSSLWTIPNNLFSTASPSMGEVRGSPSRVSCFPYLEVMDGGWSGTLYWSNEDSISSNKLKACCTDLQPASVSSTYEPWLYNKECSSFFFSSLMSEATLLTSSCKHPELDASPKCSLPRQYMVGDGLSPNGFLYHQSLLMLFIVSPSRPAVGWMFVKADRRSVVKETGAVIQRRRMSTILLSFGDPWGKRLFKEVLIIFPSMHEGLDKLEFVTILVLYLSSEVCCFLVKKVLMKFSPNFISSQDFNVSSVTSSMIPLLIISWKASLYSVNSPLFLRLSLIRFAIFKAALELLKFLGKISAKLLNSGSYMVDTFLLTLS